MRWAVTKHNTYAGVWRFTDCFVLRDLFGRTAPIDGTSFQGVSMLHDSVLIETIGLTHPVPCTLTLSLKNIRGWHKVYCWKMCMPLGMDLDCGHGRGFGCSLFAGCESAARGVLFMTESSLSENTKRSEWMNNGWTWYPRNCWLTLCSAFCFARNVSPTTPALGSTICAGCMRMLAHSLEPSTIERLERSGRKAERICGGCWQPACLLGCKG